MIKLQTNRLEIISGTLGHIRAEIDKRSLFAVLLDAEIPDNWPPPLNDGIFSQIVLLKNGFQSIGLGSEAGITRYELKKEVYTKFSR